MLVAYSGEVGNVLGNIVLCVVTLISSKSLEPRCYRKSSLIAYQHYTTPVILTYKPNHSTTPAFDAGNRLQQPAQLGADLHLALFLHRRQFLDGGIGASIATAIHALHPATRVESLGVPTQFIPHNKPDVILARYGLDAAGITAAVTRLMQ